MRLWVACGCAFALAGPVWADSAALLAAPSLPDTEAAAWMQHVANAARQLNYTGLIVYQHGNRVEISRIAHLTDASGEHEKLVNQEGPARELVRNNDEVTCFFPDFTAVRIATRELLPSFPSLLPGQIVTLSENYSFRKAEIARVAGLEAQAYVFEPKDNLRYARKLWADVVTGLLLKARTLNERNEPIEQFMFSDIQIGGKIDKDSVKPRFASMTRDWRRHAVEGTATAAGTTGWQLTDLPHGFNKIGEAYRSFPGRQEPVAHLIVSDGLVTISVFIEKLAGPPQRLGLMRQGEMNIYARRADDYLITVLGDAPESAVQRIAFAVTHR